MRAKQGGRQTVVDGGGKAIHSAGSALRRANEASLARDVRALLAVDWAHHTRAAQTLWLAVSDADRRTLVGEGAPLGRGDPRLRNVPFPTRRPTLAEAKRTALRLAQLDTGLQPQADSEDEEEGGARGGPGGAAAAHPPAVPAPDEPPLHAAARRGDVAAVAALLSAVGCDPTALFGGALAYELAPSRAVRDAFRRAAGRPGCGWDALAAGVSAPLTAEAEAAAAERRTRRAASRARDAADAQRADDARGREEEARRAEARQKDGRALEAAKAGALPAAHSPAACLGGPANALPTALSPACAPPRAGTSGKAAALLGAVRSKEAAAREARAAAAEARMRNARLG